MNTAKKPRRKPRRKYVGAGGTPIKRKIQDKEFTYNEPLPPSPRSEMINGKYYSHWGDTVWTFISPSEAISPSSHSDEHSDEDLVQAPHSQT